MRTYYWQTGTNVNPLKTSFLGRFTLLEDAGGISDDMLLELDRRVSEYSLAVPEDMRERFVSKNELMASFAISKVEKTNKLTLDEMKQIRVGMRKTGGKLVDAEGKPDDVAVLKPKRAHDRVEYANILRTYQWSLKESNITAGNLSIDLIQRVHKGLTEGLDVFEGRIMEFDPYRPGVLRDNDDIRVNNYKPVEAKEIINELTELIGFYRGNPSLANLGLFHAGLYAIHPFNNGNKRLCRILEHALLRDLGLNQANIYNHSYYYYKNANRYYGALLKGLLSENFTPIVTVTREAVFFSQLDVFRNSVEQQRDDFIKERVGSLITNDNQARVYSHLVKSKAVWYNKIVDKAKKVAERTVKDYLKQGLERGVLKKCDVGKRSYYSLNLDTWEEEMVRDYVSQRAAHITSIPDRFLASMYRPDEFWKTAGKTLDRNETPEEPEETETRGISP